MGLARLLLVVCLAVSAFRSGPPPDIRFDPADLAGSKAVIEIDAASASTPNQDIETEIKREPWFDVARHPAAKFETVSFAHKGGDRYDIAGRLTLRGVTNSALDADIGCVLEIVIDGLTDAAVSAAMRPTVGSTKSATLWPPSRRSSTNSKRC